jgi:hypothetical protein
MDNLIKVKYIGGPCHNLNDIIENCISVYKGRIYNNKSISFDDVSPMDCLFTEKLGEYKRLRYNGKDLKFKNKILFIWEHTNPDDSKIIKKVINERTKIQTRETGLTRF